MLGQRNRDNLETLFSFELLVEFVRIKNIDIFEELAVAVRLLDFPTLIIYQPQQKNRDIIQQKQNEKQEEYTFNRGKSCFFKFNLNSLHTHLLNSPLYAMVLDVKGDIPKLVGSSTISLAKVVDRINQHVTEYGVSTPSSYGERGIVYVCSLTGEKIGSLSLSYKLLSLGPSLLPHIINRSDIKSTGLHGGPHISEPFSLDHEALDRSNSPNIQNNRLANVEGSVHEHKQDDDTVRGLTEHRPRSHNFPSQQETDNSFEEDVNIFCPPLLHYTNSLEEKSKTDAEDYTFFTQYPEAVTFEESEDETASNEFKGPRSPVVRRKATHNTKMSSNQETGGLNPNILRETLEQLPLLNALFVELSQLTGHNPHQPLSIHPSLSGIYRPGKTPQTKLSQKTRQTSPHFKPLHATRNCSTPIVAPTTVKKEDKQNIESNHCSKTRRKKLVYGTTKTYNLRVKLISPKVKQHECMELKLNNPNKSVAKRITKPSITIVKSNTRKSTFNQSSGHNDNIETVMQSITVKSSLQEPAPKEKSIHGNIHGKQERDSLGISEKCSLSEKDLKCIHIPTVNSNIVPRNKDRYKPQSGSNQSRTECEKHREKMRSSKSTKCSSPESSLLDSSGEGNEEADYADDFNSLEASDAYSRDPVSSPELSRAKTPKSPVCPNLSNSDSGSEPALKRPVFPMPIKTHSSPQRSLRGTHIIRPRTQTSALRFSSDDDDYKNGSFSLQSRKKMTNHKSVSSVEQQEAEELEDVLGSLDFRKEYQHISELVVNNLPGYTM